MISILQNVICLIYLIINVHQIGLHLAVHIHNHVTAAGRMAILVANVRWTIVQNYVPTHEGHLATLNIYVQAKMNIGQSLIQVRGNFTAAPESTLS